MVMGWWLPNWRSAAHSSIAATFWWSVEMVSMTFSLIGQIDIPLFIYTFFIYVTRYVIVGILSCCISVDIWCVLFWRVSIDVRIQAILSCFVSVMCEMMYSVHPAECWYWLRNCSVCLSSTQVYSSLVFNWLLTVLKVSMLPPLYITVPWLLIGVSPLSWFHSPGWHGQVDEMFKYFETIFVLCMAALWLLIWSLIAVFVRCHL